MWEGGLYRRGHEGGGARVEECRRGEVVGGGEEVELCGGEEG